MAIDGLGPVQSASNVFGSSGKLDALQSEFGLNDKEMGLIQKMADKSGNPAQFLDDLEKMLGNSGAGKAGNAGSSGSGGAGGQEGGDIMQLIMKLLATILNKMAGGGQPDGAGGAGMGGTGAGSPA